MAPRIFRLTSDGFFIVFMVARLFGLTSAGFLRPLYSAEF